MAKRFRLPLFLQYLRKVLSRALTGSYSLSQNWLGYCFIAVWILAAFARVLSLARFAPNLELLLETDYRMVSAVAWGAFVLFRVAVAPYWIYRDQSQALDRAQAEAHDVSSRLALAREQIQTIGDFDVRQIPNTLGEMHSLVKRIFEERRNNSHAPEKCAEAIIDLLDVDAESPLLSQGRYATKKQVSHMIKVFRRRMGIKKGSSKKAKIWMYRIVDALDRNDIGLALDRNHEYDSLKAALERHRRPISATRLSASIDDFVDGLEGLYSLRLLVEYGRTRDYLHLLPDEAKDFLAELGRKTEAVMHGGMVNVNIPLEAWLIGASDDARRRD